MRDVLIPCSSYNLEGVWHDANRPSEKMFIISHGFRGSMDGSSKASLLAEQVTSLGLHVLRYAFTPCQSLTSQIDELTAVVQFARSCQVKEIYLLGRSMGGAASLAVADSLKISGLCLWSTPSDLEETFRLVLGFDYDLIKDGTTKTFEDEWGSVTLEPEFIHDFLRHGLLRHAALLPPIPVLVIHGAADQIVPVHQAETLYGKLKHPKEWVLIEEADHQLNGHAHKARQIVFEWLQRILEKNS